MKWFEKHTTDRNDRASKQIKRKFGIAGYGIYESLQQIVAENMEGENYTEWGYVASHWSMESLAEEIGCSIDEFRAFVSFCDEQLILEKRDGRLFLPLLLERMNEYAKRSYKKSQEAKNRDSAVKTETTEYRDNPDTTDNRDISASQHITTQSQSQNIKEKENKKKSDALDDEFCIATGAEFNIAIPEVRKKCLAFEDYCASKGKRYKSKRATVRGWIRNDIRDGKIKHLLPVASMQYNLPKPEEVISPERVAELRGRMKGIL